ncbi:MAG: hypothetical protein QW379_01705 [Thermoplasmata archaeon]
MRKIPGLGESAHIVLGVVFLLLFCLGLVSGAMYLVQGDTASAGYVLGVCAFSGLLPAIIFFHFAVRLAKERMELERLGLYLAKKGRASVSGVAFEFKWTEAKAEERIVAAISENKVAGNLDRVTREFFTDASLESMEFVPRCGSCGAIISAWVSKREPAKCPYCNSEPRPNFVSPPQHGVHVPLIYAPPRGAPAQYRAAPPGPPSEYAGKAPGARAVPPSQPSALPIPGTGGGTVLSYPAGAPPAPPVMPRRKRRVRFLLFSMKSGTMKAVGFSLFILGLIALAAAIYISDSSLGRSLVLRLDFELVDGYLTPDESEFVVSLRPEDVRSVRVCPICHSPNINIQVIRGGSEKCPYCSGLIYFPEVS